MGRSIERILVYTHNSVGIGHAFRTLAVITGIRHHRPDIDFLVLSGSSIPQIFLNESIEVVKLPGIRKEVDDPGSPMKPRLLAGFSAGEVFEYRRRIIMDSYEFFSPDVVMVEHYMGGLMGEVMPLIMKKRSRAESDSEFALVHFSRGICRGIDPSGPHAGDCWTPSPLEIAGDFDFIYVFEDMENVDINREHFGNNPDLSSRIHYLGRITAKASRELPPRPEVLERFGLSDKPVVLMTLGRHGPILDMARSLLDSLEHHGLRRSHQVVMVLDPYLDDTRATALREDLAARDVLFLSFTPHLVDFINIADLVICRAGYNIINEVLLTGARALVIPERHPSGEQERRCGLLNEDGIVVADEEAILDGRAFEILGDLLSRPVTPSKYAFDKFAIGRSIVQGLETWINRR